MSQIDRILIFAFNHQTVIIELLFAMILGIVVVWLFTHLSGEAGEQTGKNHDLDEIEEALRRVLQNSDFKMTAAQSMHMIKDDDIPLPDADLPPPGMDGAAVSAMQGTAAAGAPAGGAAGAAAGTSAGGGDVAKLMGEMTAKNQKLGELEKALAQAKEELAKAQASASGASAGTDELQNKIKTLESRLAEYEIIEDDIANLSLYKEENIKLKAELERLRRGGAPASEPAPSAPAAPAAEAHVPTAAAAPAPAAASAPEVQASAPEPQAPADKFPLKEEKIDSDKLLKEFDALVAQEAKKSAVPTPAPPPTDAKAETKDGGEKLIEEFENFMKGNNG